MKDNIEIGHLSKFDACRSNRDQVTDLKSIQTSLSLRLRPPKPDLGQLENPVIGLLFGNS